MGAEDSGYSYGRISLTTVVNVANIGGIRADAAVVVS